MKKDAKREVPVYNFIRDIIGQCKQTNQFLLNMTSCCKFSINEKDKIYKVELRDSLGTQDINIPLEALYTLNIMQNIKKIDFALTNLSKNTKITS